MEVNPINAAQHTSSKNRTLRHAGNAAVCATGLVATGVGALKLASIADFAHGQRIAYANGAKKVFTKDLGSVYRFFAKMGNKLFNDSTKIGQAIKRFVTGELPSGGRIDSKYVDSFISKYKTLGAIGLVAGVLSLGLIGSTIYKAGKINADK